ncbi:MAG: hypothetical protein GY754_29355 [bacterium]|nr:hypothetical protein [bacterium]
MNKDPFEIVTEYCRSIKKGSSIRNTAFCLYYKKYLSAVKKHTAEKGGELSVAEIENIKNTLLTAEAVEHDIFLAESVFKESAAQLEVSFKKKYKRGNFHLSLWASVLGTFIYSVLLLVVFKLAEEQVKAWLSGFMK